MNEIEQAIKTLLDVSGTDMVRFAWGKEGFTFQDVFPPVYVPDGKFTVDHLYRVRRHEEGLVQLEAFAVPTPDVPELIFTRGGGVWCETHMPILSTLYWLVKEEEPPPSPYRWWIAGKPTLEWGFHTIDIPRLPASTLLEAELPGLVPLVAFAADANAAIIETARRQLPSGPPRQQADLLESLLLCFWAYRQNKE